MHPIAKRKSETQLEVTDSKKKRVLLSNLTNFKSPKGKNFQERTMPEKGSVAVTDSGSVTHEASQIMLSQVPMTQSQIKCDGVEMMRCIKKVQEENFKNVSERLQLDSKPTCLYDLKRCHEFHSSKLAVEIAESESQYLAKNLLIEQRHTQFVMYVRNNMCARKVFPGVPVVLGVLELIMVSC